MKKGIATAVALAFIVTGAMLGDSQRIGLCLIFVGIGCVITYLIYGTEKETKNQGHVDEN
jgi:hypothetical protein